MSNNPREINKNDFYRCKDQYARMLFLLRYAILAPSTHNSQPWLFKIEGSYCRIYYNDKLLIPIADPSMRDLHISIGCAIENLVIASNYFNMFESVAYGPFDDCNLLATFKMKDEITDRPNSTYEPLLGAILKRINARGIFKKTPIQDSLISDIDAKLKIEEYLQDTNVSFIQDKSRIEELARFTASGLRQAYRSRTFRKEMSSWMNNSLSFKKHGLHGYSLKMPFFLSFLIPILVRFKDIGAFLSEKNYQSVRSAPLAVIITAKENSEQIWLKTGRLAQRLMLEFYSKGLNTSIFVASIEIGDLYKEVQKLLNSTEIPQFLFVVGKIDSLHRFTPRHSLEETLIK